MWAMAIYDTRRNGLLLSRDRFGEKPLFWTSWRGGVAFASEIKQLRAFPDIAIDVDLRRAASFLRSGRPYDGASSWFEGIHQIGPAATHGSIRPGTTNVVAGTSKAVAAVVPEHDPDAGNDASPMPSAIRSLSVFGQVSGRDTASSDRQLGSDRRGDMAW